MNIDHMSRRTCLNVCWYSKGKIIPGVVTIMYKRQYFWAVACFKVKKTQLCLALLSFDVLMCLSFSRLVTFVSFLPPDVMLHSGRRDGNKNQVGGFQSQNCKKKCNINSKPKINRNLDDALKNLNHCQPRQTKKQQRTFLRNSSATIRALALTDSFISLISLSISSIKWMTKSTNLCLYICSVWKLVIRKLIS